ncbi:MAG TPA: TraR/DksA family transcriptional regulator [Acidimicrobiales bacterium]|nr:TraR/DksA family transcriptional regulator [Acidimicrobiales bacterium]
MPRGKQQDPVKAQEADVAVHARANGASRTSKGPATTGKGTEKAESKPTSRVTAKAIDAPTKAVTPGTRHTAAKTPNPGKTATAAVAKRAGAKEANGAPAAAPKAAASPKPAGTSPKVEKPKAAKAVRDHKTAGPGGHAVAQDTGGDDHEPRDLFLNHQRVLLMAERNNYTRQAEELRAQAEALALEHEPGDVQFDEEGGEGGTANVDRELDLHLSAQAQAAIEEIDAALVKIAEDTYGFCESCGNPVPKARLEALPHARLCVSCKSGGLSARRQ